MILIATNDAKKAEEERRIVQLLNEEARVHTERRTLQMHEDARHEADVDLQRKQLMEVALGEREQEDVVTVTSTTTSVPIDMPITAEMQAAMMGFQPGHISGPQPVPVPGGKKGSAFNEDKAVRKRQQRAGGYDPKKTLLRNQNEAWMGILLQT